MRQIRNRFSVVLRTSEGHQFRGEWGDPGSYPRPRAEIVNLPHRGLTVDRTALVNAGDLVNGNGVRYLLLGQNVLTHVKRFLAIEVNHEASWKRMVSITDPVTRQEGAMQQIELDAALPVVVEPRAAIEEQNFSQSHSRAFTAGDVKQGDTLDGKKVLMVSNLLGIRMLELV